MKWAVVERKVDVLCKLQVIKISTSSRQIEVRVKRTAGGPPTKPPVWPMVALTISRRSTFRRHIYHASKAANPVTTDDRV